MGSGNAVRRLLRQRNISKIRQVRSFVYAHYRLHRAAHGSAGFCRNIGNIVEQSAQLAVALRLGKFFVCKTGHALGMPDGPDRKSAVWGKSVYVPWKSGGGRI